MYPPAGHAAELNQCTCPAWLGRVVMAVLPFVLAASVWSKPIVGEDYGHWAFIPIETHPLPDVKWDDLVRSPVDRFLLARLEHEGLEPAPPVDRQTLLRRVTYDLIGLPPTIAEVEAFLADKSPDAYAKVVDRLLKSPHYGEHWGRHWLDAARYADTKGYIYAGREDHRFFHSHIYRDWVIQALNRDMPVDQFLMQQIAGDYLATDEDRSPLAAMGFVTLGRRFAGNFYEIIDDRIDTLTRTTMGLTVTCARCHDHMFDPILADDYYALYSIFSGSYDAVAPVSLPQGELSSEYSAFAKELQKRQQAYDDLLKKKSDERLAQIRSRTAEYLASVLEVETLPTEHEYRQLAPEDFNPVFTRQWHSYLIRRRTRFDPIFEPWLAMADVPDSEFAAGFKKWMADFNGRLNPRVAEALTGTMPGSMRELAKQLGKLFEEVNQQWLSAIESATKNDGESVPAALPDEADETLRLVLYGPDSVIYIPQDHSNIQEWCFDEPTRNEMGKLQMHIEQWMVDSPNGIEHVVYLADKDRQSEPRVFRNGNPATKGKTMPRQFLADVLGPPSPLFEHGSGRLGLAHTIASPDNPLTARVFVNRVWLNHFGSGLVSDPSDFGLMSEPPSHPKLLDWLAGRFIADGWSLKKLHRLIVLSHAYRQTIDASDAASRHDPHNVMLSRMNRRRLNYESLRDSLLAVSGELDLTLGGRPLSSHNPDVAPRRSVYSYIDRQNIPAVMRTFDVPSPDVHSPERHETTVPQQALYLMNSPFLLNRVRALVAQPEIADAKSAVEQVHALYRIVFQRPATPRELALGTRMATAPIAEAIDPPPVIWAYGTGAYDSAQEQLTDFQPLPHFSNATWHSGDPKVDASLTASGGHADNDLSRVVIRRWISPVEANVSVTGTIGHENDKGDGVRAVIVSSRSGELAAFNLRKSSVEIKLNDIHVQKGDTFDFVVLCRTNATGDEFTWSPVIREQKEKEDETEESEHSEWSASEDFSGPPPEPLTPKEKYAQVLLLTNEFAFVD